MHGHNPISVTQKKERTLKSVQYRTGQDIGSSRIVERANETVMVAAPEMDEALLDRLFALARPLDVNLLTSRSAVKDGGRRLRNQIKRLQDINLNIDVRVADEDFPAFAIVDEEHLHCFFQRSKEMAEDDAHSFADAAESLMRNQS